MAAGQKRQSGSGTRTAFSQGFIRDFALVWAEEGLDAVRKVAKKSPEAFVAIAARIVPTMSGLRLNKPFLGMSLEDYSLMREVIAAIREGLPDADQMQPGAVFQHVLGALRNCPNTARPCSAQTEARSFRKLWLNTVRLPTGMPFGLPETPGGHIRPFTCLLCSKAISSVSFC
jgi:hypothetical protein